MDHLEVDNLFLSCNQDIRKSGESSFTFKISMGWKRFGFLCKRKKKNAAFLPTPTKIKMSITLLSTCLGTGALALDLN